MSTPLLLTADRVLEYLKNWENGISRRELSRAFDIKGPDRIALKALLKKMVETGDLYKEGRIYSLPKEKEFFICELSEEREEGLFYGRPLEQHMLQDNLKVILSPKSFHHKKSYKVEYKVGDQVLVRIQRRIKNTLHGEIVRKITGPAPTLIGIFSEREGGYGFVTPTDRAQKQSYIIAPSHTLHAQEGDLVSVEPLSNPAHPRPKGCVRKILASLRKPKSLSLIAIHTHNLPFSFSPEALAEAEKAQVPSIIGREDLRDYPLVTIDDEDARDFDDAIFAEPDPHTDGGWHLIVAIADVSYYVTPHSPLDNDAYERGNSVYFPDRVIPMLPETLSNELCSLKPDEDRGCFAVHLWVDGKGNLTKHRFVQGLMRSHGRLTYKEVDAAYHGQLPQVPASLLTRVVHPLYSAYAVLEKARRQRQPLELTLTEQQIVLNKGGGVQEIRTRPHFTSHRLIEDFMILANVAAAQTLESHGMLGVYRVHEIPPAEKVQALKDYLKTTDFPFPSSPIVKPKAFNVILEKVLNTPFEASINTLVLRSQTQANYSPNNIGHFGLNLRQYCHFTSPIRRYADLLVHRALIKCLKLEKKPQFPYDFQQLEKISEHISVTERKASTAERETVNRYMTLYLSQKVGQKFTALISSVTKFALFIALKDTGADGMLPLRLFKDDYYVFEEQKQRVVGRHHKHVLKLGDIIDVILEEANMATGQLLFSLAPHQKLDQEIGIKENTKKKQNRIKNRKKKKP